MRVSDYAFVTPATADFAFCLVQEKKYTKDHEWIELSEDGKTGITPRKDSPSAQAFPCSMEVTNSHHGYFFGRHNRRLGLCSQESR